MHIFKYYIYVIVVLVFHFLVHLDL
jgi:hypothetical protein